MKHLLLVFSMLTFTASSYSQPDQNPETKHAYYDALELRKYIIIDESGHPIFDSTKAGKIDSILAKYLDASLGQTVAIVYLKNPFIKRYVPYRVTPQGDTTLELHAGGGELSSLSAGLLGSIGAMDVTKPAQALADVMIKRAKEELNVAFFNRMKKFLDDNVEGRLLFPSTREFLDNIHSYQYAEFINTLRNAFYKDLENIPVNLDRLIDDEKYKKLLKDYPEIRTAVRVSKIVNQLSQDESSIKPDSVITLLAEIDETQEINPNLKSSFQLLDLISKNLKYVDTTPSDSDRIWITYSDMYKLTKDKVTANLFLGLMYPQLVNVNFGSETGLVNAKQFLLDNYDNIYVALDLFEGFVILANDVDMSVKDLRSKAKSNNLTDEDYYKYINKTIDIVEYGFKVANTIKPEIANNDYIVIARHGTELYRHIYEKKYNSAIADVYSIFERIITIAELRQPDSQKHNHEMRIISGVLKYGNLMASIVVADNSEEIEEIIEATMLPVGSSSIKKKTRFNIALNSYVGYYSGPKVRDTLTAWNSNRGITAPIGFTISYGLGKAGSLSAFGTLLNLGAIVDYRLSNDSTDIDQKIKLANIFSPGVYFVYGFPFNIPISIGYGGQYGPNLFASSDHTLKLIEKPGWRSNWFVTVDIPLLNIVSVDKFKK